MKYSQFEGAEIFEEASEVVVPEQLDPKTMEVTLKNAQCDESDNDKQDKNGPLQRKGGFRVSPGTTRRNW